MLTELRRKKGETQGGLQKELENHKKEPELKNTITKMRLDDSEEQISDLEEQRKSPQSEQGEKRILKMSRV